MDLPTSSKSSQKSDTSAHEKDAIEVQLDASEDPKNMSSLRKWVITLIICSAAACVTCASSMASLTLTKGIQPEFHIGYEVAVLSISLFVLGISLGPLLLGPMSEFLGRNGIYRYSYAAFTLLTFPVAFANNVAVHMIFRFLTGFTGAAFVSVSGGTMSDMFTNEAVANPMAIFTLSPFFGPVLGPVISGFINQNLNWRWTYYILIIWCSVEFALLALFVPETHVPFILKKKAQKLRAETGDPRYFAPLEKASKGIGETLKISCSRPFLLMAYEPMITLLNLWTALILAIVYLTFAAFPIIFGEVHHFNMQMTGLSFLGIGAGMVCATASQPIWNAVNRREMRKYNGTPPPESRLYTGMLGGLLVPLGLFWFAFTIYPGIHWIVPIIASAPFGAGIIFVYGSVWTFLVSTYREHSASVMASNAFVRCMLCMAFPIIARPMFRRMGNVGAMAFLAGLTLLMAPLPFFFYKYGPILRKKSRYSSNSL